VNLHRDAKFTKPLGKNGFGHSFCFFIFNRRDECVFCEGTSDAQNVFVLAPKRSAWMRMLGWSGISSGCNDGGLSVDDYLLWQVRQVFMYWRMFE